MNKLKININIYWSTREDLIACWRCQTFHFSDERQASENVLIILIFSFLIGLPSITISQSFFFKLFTLLYRKLVKWNIDYNSIKQLKYLCQAGFYSVWLSLLHKGQLLLHYDFWFIIYFFKYIGYFGYTMPNIYFRNGTEAAICKWKLIMWKKIVLSNNAKVLLFIKTKIEYGKALIVNGN